jgi:hypothetical protein
MRVLLTCGLLSLLLLPGLVRPATAVACTGCLESFRDTVGTADRVLLGTFVTAASDGSYRFRVERALRGSARGVIVFAPGAVSDFAVGSRWILVLYPKQGLDTAVAFEVRPNGSIAPAGPFESPATLTAFEAWFGIPQTDTSPAPTRRRAPAWPLLLIPAVAAAVAVTIRRTGRR